MADQESDVFEFRAWTEELEARKLAGMCSTLGGDETGALNVCCGAACFHAQRATAGPGCSGWAKMPRQIAGSRRAAIRGRAAHRSPLCCGWSQPTAGSGPAAARAAALFSRNNVINNRLIGSSEK